MLIDLVQLRTFVAVAEEQHLTRAAERLHISQSAASAHVRAVEESLDAHLFVRTNRSLELTRAGQLLLQRAKLLLNEAVLFTSFARELRGKIEGNLIVASSSEPVSRIGELIAALRSLHPLVSVDLRARPSSSALLGLKSGELDIGIVLGRPVEAGFTYYELTRVQFRVAGPAAWKQEIQAADWAGLAKLPWITPTGSTAYTEMLAELFATRGLELNSVVRFDNAALARTMLRAGVGLMLMREDYAREGEAAGIVATSPFARAEVALSVAHLASRREDPLIRAFIEATSVAWPEMKPVNPCGVKAGAAAVSG